MSYKIIDNALTMTLGDTSTTRLENIDQYIGYQGDIKNPNCILLKNNNLHVELLIDKSGNIGANDSAGINDIIIESALTTIQDC